MTVWMVLGRCLMLLGFGIGVWHVMPLLVQQNAQLQFSILFAPLFFIIGLLIAWRGRPRQSPYESGWREDDFCL